MHNTTVASLALGLVAILTGCGGGGAANPRTLADQASVDADPVPDPAAGRNRDQHRALRDD